MNNLPKVILDTDIGDDIDDAFALLLLLESHKFDVLGITTVFRNSIKRAKMAKQLIDSLGYDIKVYPGIDNPLKVSIDDLISPEIKQKEKVDENNKYLIPQWDESMEKCQIENKSAVDFIVESVNKYPNEITIIPIGPMTNIASAIKKDPSIANKITVSKTFLSDLDISNFHTCFFKHFNSNFARITPLRTCFRICNYFFNTTLNNCFCAI